MQQNSEFFPSSLEQNRLEGGGEERRHRFLDSHNGDFNLHSRSGRAASQPPQQSDHAFLSNPIPSSLGRTTSALSTSPWSPSSSSRPTMPQQRPGLSVPGRSSSFSSSNTHGNFASAMRDRHFDSTFEDDESEAFSDAFDDRYSFPSRDTRGRPSHLHDPTRSRSQSLATAHTRPGPIGGSYVSGGGSPGGIWKDSLSNPLNIPGGRYDPRAPGSRYGSMGTIGRSPGNAYHNASSPTTGMGNGFSSRQTIDPSNMSPFVRDVGAILLDEGSAYRELWGGNIPKDENGGGGSGTTSRRHSVSVVQPRRGSNIVGFNAPDSNIDAFDEPSFAPPGRSGLLLSDDDLASDLGLLNMGPGPGQLSGHPSVPPNQPSSMPIYNPISNHLNITPTSLSRHSPSDSVGGTSPSHYDHEHSQLRQQAARFIPGQGIFLPGAGQNGQGTLISDHRARAPSVTSPMSPSIHQPYPRRLSEAGQAPLATELGKGVPLHAVPPSWPLYIVEFKAGRTDLFYLTDAMKDQVVRVGDLVIVEADRGKDLGKVVNDTITLSEVEAFQRQQVAKSQEQAHSGMGADGVPTSPGGGPAGGGGKKEINPKMIYGKASQGDTACVFFSTLSGFVGGVLMGIFGSRLLLAKIQDEVKALQLCQSKVRAKKLPMEVVDAEYQWLVSSPFSSLCPFFARILMGVQGPPQVDVLLYRGEENRFP